MMPMFGTPMTAMPTAPPMQGTPHGVAIPSNPMIPVAPAFDGGRRRGGGGNGALFAILGVAAAGLIGVGLYFAFRTSSTNGNSGGNVGGATTTSTTTTTS